MKLRSGCLCALVLIFLSSLDAVTIPASAQDRIPNQFGSTPQLRPGLNGHQPEVAPSSSAEKVLYNFCSASACSDGVFPNSALVQDAAGNLYGTVVNGGMFVVPDALGSKIIHLYGDFLLHDVGTGDGIFQAGPQDTVNKLRTAPLWGVRMKARLMHDLASPTLEDAIGRHAGEARRVTRRFQKLTATEKQQLIAFLNSL